MTNAELIEALRYCANVDNICTEIENCGYYGKGFCQDTMMRDAADALEADGKRIAELEAQLPKEGVWIIDGAYTYNLRELNDKAYEPVYRCSCCNRQTESYLRLDEPKMPEDADFPEYCPHCGAKMKGENDE